MTEGKPVRSITRVVRGCATDAQYQELVRNVERTQVNFYNDAITDVVRLLGGSALWTSTPGHIDRDLLEAVRALKREPPT